MKDVVEGVYTLVRSTLFQASEVLIKGALGYFSLDGATDLSVVIRTIIVEGSRKSILLTKRWYADFRYEYRIGRWDNVVIEQGQGMGGGIDQGQKCSWGSRGSSVILQVGHNHHSLHITYILLYDIKCIIDFIGHRMRECRIDFCLGLGLGIAHLPNSMTDGYSAALYTSHCINRGTKTV